jgi:hypothetical protein
METMESDIPTEWTHLDAGLPITFRGSLDLTPTSTFLYLTTYLGYQPKENLQIRQSNRMTQGNEIARSLGCHYTSQTSRLQDVALAESLARFGGCGVCGVGGQ